MTVTLLLPCGVEAEKNDDGELEMPSAVWIMNSVMVWDRSPGSAVVENGFGVGVAFGGTGEVKAASEGDVHKARVHDDAGEELKEEGSGGVKDDEVAALGMLLAITEVLLITCQCFPLFFLPWRLKLSPRLEATSARVRWRRRMGL